MVARKNPLRQAVRFLASMTVQLRIQELMEEAQYASAHQLARAVEGTVSRATVYRIVSQRGRVSNVSASTLLAFSELFGCEVADLFERASRR